MSGRDLRVDGRPPAAPVIVLVRTELWHEASEAMQDAVERAARAAETAGAKIKELDLPPIFGEAMRAHRVIQGYEAFRALAFEYDRCRERLRSRSCAGSSMMPRPSMPTPTTTPAARRAALAKRCSISWPTAR